MQGQVTERHNKLLLSSSGLANLIELIEANTSDRV